MMEESPEEAAKREGMLKMYHACKEALRIIGEFKWIRANTNLILTSSVRSIRRCIDGNSHNTSSTSGQE